MFKILKKANKWDKLLLAYLILAIVISIIGFIIFKDIDLIAIAILFLTSMLFYISSLCYEILLEDSQENNKKLMDLCSKLLTDNSELIDKINELEKAKIKSKKTTKSTKKEEK